MKRLLGTALALGVAGLMSPSSAQAAAFLEINVGGVTVSCNTAIAACAGGFTGALGSNTISFTGVVNGVSFAGTGGVEGVQLDSNQPGGLTAFATDTKTNVTNNSGASQNITVSFAVNGFTTPTGSPLQLAATQNATNIAGPAFSQDFTGFGDDADTLTPGAGLAVSATPTCNTLVAPPNNSCSTNGPTVNFARDGTFALSGIQSFTLANLQNINASGTVQAFGGGGGGGGQTVPEPATLALLGAGLLAAARRFRRQA